MYKLLLTFVLSLFLISIIYELAAGQSVTLRGKQFKDENGNDFYPISMNYGVEIGRPQGSTTISDYYISPLSNYGSTSCFECNDETSCLNQIKADFGEIASMGFNTVHVYGLSPKTFYHLDNQSPHYGFFLYLLDNPACNGSYVSIQPFSTSPYIPMLFSFIDEVIDIAASTVTRNTPRGLKLIIDGQTNEGFNTNVDPTIIDDYADYLELLADHIKNHSVVSAQKTLMAYILVGEPIWNHEVINRTKANVCDITTQWYQALKDKDPGHLVASGGWGLSEIFEWDPGVIKSDFYVPHIYLEHKDYEDDGFGAYQHNFADEMERMNGVIYWIGNNSPVPWMIGETGFSADATFSNKKNDGDYSQQKMYFQQTLNAVRNCGGSGFTPWQYQDVWWDGNYQDNFGLLKHGDLSNGNIEKPVVDVFRNYYVNGKPPDPEYPTSLPNNYYDPCHADHYCRQYFNTTDVPYVTGTTILKDPNGVDQPNVKIKDAIVRAHTFRKQTSSTDPCYPCPVDNVTYTFTDNNGHYSLTPFDPETPALTDYSKQYIRWIEVSGLGASVAQENTWGWTGLYDPIPKLPPNVSTPANQGIVNFSLFKVKPDANDNLTGPLNITTQNNIYNAFCTLKVSNGVTFTSTSSADIYALKEVHVENEFHATVGSDVHIFNAPVLVDCSEINAATPTPHNGFRYSNSTNNSSISNTLELIFRKSKPYINIYPNPGTGIFNIDYYGPTDALKQAKVFDMIGNLVYDKTFTSSSTILNLSHLEKAIYSIRIGDESTVFNQEIIIQ